LSAPSMWSKERFSIISTTICLRLSKPGGIRRDSCYEIEVQVQLGAYFAA
jgi:hypothetical protein